MLTCVSNWGELSLPVHEYGMSLHLFRPFFHQHFKHKRTVHVLSDLHLSNFFSSDFFQVLIVLHLKCYIYLFISGILNTMWSVCLFSCNLAGLSY